MRRAAGPASARLDVGWTVNETYRLAVEADGPYIKCYVDGKLVIQHTDEGYRQPQASGQVGFRLVKCTAEFDNLALGEVSRPSVTITVPAGTVTSMPVSLSGAAAEAGSVELTPEKGRSGPKDAECPGSGGRDIRREAYLPSGTYTAEAVALSKRRRRPVRCGGEQAVHRGAARGGADGRAGQERTGCCGRARAGGVQRPLWMRPHWTASR